jgi:hypothetical protein
MKRVYFFYFYISLSLFSFSSITSAAGNPWLISPETTSIQLSYVKQSTDELYAGETRGSLPDDLTQTTTWVDFAYGLADNMSIDARLGYSNFEFSTRQDESGTTDASLGLTWRFRDEFVHDTGPSAALRVGVTLAGDYTEGKINSIGDGASGAEISLIVGKIIAAKLSIATDVGYRYRDSGVDNERFASVRGFYSLTNQLHTSVGYSIVRANGNLDISDSQFMGNFTELAEDVDIVELSVAYQFAGSYQVGFGYGKVVDGRNTGRNKIASISLGRTF